MPKYPNVEVRLSGEDGNIFSIMARVSKAMRKAGLDATDVKEYTSAMMACGSYDAALQLTMKWVSTS